MTTDHPMKLTLEQFNDLICQDPNATWFDRLSLAYAAGADAQLEACCKWTADRTTQWSDGTWPAEALRAAMRPKPRSLAEQALTLLYDSRLDAAHENCIRRALERLAELEGRVDA